MTCTTADHDNLRALRRIQKLSLHLLQPLPSLDSQSYDDDIRIIPSPCACGHGRPPLSVSLTELAKYMKGRHREIQDRIISFLASRLELQTPVEISTADHRELCMQQLTALVREAGIRPLRYVIEDPSVYFAILEAAGSIDISLGIKLAGQYRSFTFLALCNHFGILHNDHDIFQTFEGANAVLLQQVAGEPLKQYKSKFCGGTLTVTWNYLKESMASHISQPNPVTTRWQSEDHLRDPNFQLDAFRYRTSRLLQSLVLRLRKHTKSLGVFGAWNRCLNHLLTLAEFHIESVILSKFIEAVQKCPDKNTGDVLKVVCDLFALDRIWNDIGTYRNADYVAPNKAKAIHKLVEYLSFQVRGIARELVDAFSLPEIIIRAPIGMASEAYSQHTEYVWVLIHNTSCIATLEKAI